MVVKFRIFISADVTLIAAVIESHLFLTSFSGMYVIFLKQPCKAHIFYFFWHE